MADCIHGFSQGQCLICSTLSGSSSQGASKTQVAERPAPASALGNGAASPAAITKPATKPARRTKAVPAGEDSKPASKGNHHIVTVVLVVVVGLLAFALVQGVLGLAIRVAEYVAVALLAGWVGYRVGHWRGRHDRET